jgi:pimeloyl-ACP methyl ester carboxylesterase
MMRVALVLAALACPLAGCASFHAGPMPGEPRIATFASVEGARVRYVDVGQGPPVVLVHGFASSLGNWDPVLPELAKHHRVLALDLKGFGWTDRPEGDYSPSAEARLVLRLMDHVGIGRAAFVGHSWGSSVVLAAALAEPARVERIALYDAFVYEEQLPTFFTVARAPGVGEALFGLFYKERADERMTLAFHDPEVVTEEFAEYVASMLERPGTVAAALAAVRGMRFAEIESRYRTITQPTLLLWGREDVVTPVAIGERLAHELPSARLVVYPRCGHFPMLEARAASNAELVAFLAAPHAPAAPPSPPPSASSASTPSGPTPVPAPAPSPSSQPAGSEAPLGPSSKEAP